MARTPTLWIRRYRDEHRGALRAVLPTGMLDAIDGHRKSRDGVSCLLLDDRVIGVAVLTRGGQISVFVHPSVQRRGIGEVAVRHLIKVARRACLGRVHGVARPGSAGATLARKVGLREVKRDAQRAHYELRLQ